MRVRQSFVLIGSLEYLCLCLIYMRWLVAIIYGCNWNELMGWVNYLHL